MPRRLLTTRRSVPLDRSEEYHAAWARVKSTVEVAGGHAWRFQSTRRQDRFIEFIESRGPDPILEVEAVADARDALEDTFGWGSTEEWEETSSS